MRRSLGVVALCVVSFVAGAVLQRLYDCRGLVSETTVPAEPAASARATAAEPAAPIDFANQPLWAYGFLESPKLGDKANRRRRPRAACR